MRKSRQIPENNERFRWVVEWMSECVGQETPNSHTDTRFIFFNNSKKISPVDLIIWKSSFIQNLIRLVRAVSIHTRIGLNYFLSFFYLSLTLPLALALFPHIILDLSVPLASQMITFSLGVTLDLILFWMRKLDQQRIQYIEDLMPWPMSATFDWIGHTISVEWAIVHINWTKSTSTN